MDRGDFIMLGVVAVAVVGAAYYAKKKIGSMIPPVVQDGVQAAGLIGSNFANMLTDPLDAFGVRPPVNNVWVITTPWENQNDPVSNNSTGMNFNYF